MNDQDTSPQEFRFLSLVSLLVLVIGTIFYHFVEHFTWLNAIYFCVVTLSTVGYGDITPKTAFGKIFTIFYILIGIGILGFFINTLVKRAYYRRIQRQEKNKIY